MTERKESSELPGRLSVLIADDEQRYRNAIMSAFQAINPGYTVRVARGSSGLVEVALSENSLKPQLITLDERYEEDKAPGAPSWQFTPLMQQVVSQYIARHRLPVPDRERLFVPNSLNFAALLRMSGYNGQIAVISSAPPLEFDIVTLEKELAIAVLLNAKLNKPSNFDREYSVRWSQNGEIHTANPPEVNLKFPDGLKWVLANLFTPSGSQS